MPCFGCSAPETIRAHIIPRGFAKDALDGDKNLIAVTRDSFRYSQSGHWDSGILCAKCDGKLGKYDDYALDAVRKLRSFTLLPGTRVELPFSGLMLRYFVNAVLWRASISRQFPKVSLGPLELSIGEVLLNGSHPKHLLPIGVYPFCISEFKANSVYSYPVAFRLANGWRAFSFVLGGIRWVAVADRRVPLAFWESYIDGRASIQTTVLDMKQMDEFASMGEFIELHAGQFDREDARRALAVNRR